MVFRKKFLVNYQDKSGEVLKLDNRKFRLIGYFSVLFIALSFAVIFSLHYPKRIIVSGYIDSSQYQIQVFPERSGTIDNIFVKNNQYVEIGQPLFKITKDSYFRNKMQYKKLVVSSINSQIKYISNEKKINSYINKVNKYKIKDDIEKDKIRIKSLSLNIKEMKLEKYRILTLIKSYDKLVRKKMAVSKNYIDYKNKVSEINVAINNDNMEIEKISKDIDSGIRKVKLNKLGLEMKNIKADESIENLKIKLVNIDNDYSSLVIAKKAGVITSISYAEGQKVDINNVVMTMLPNNSKIVAIIQLSSKSAGFVKNGDPVFLTLDAFSFQKFGSLKGIVSSIDSSLSIPNGLVVNKKMNMPTYKVVVSISKKDLLKFSKGKEIKLGMSLKASVLVEDRTIFDWLFSPIYK